MAFTPGAYWCETGILLKSIMVAIMVALLLVRFLMVQHIADEMKDADEVLSILKALFEEVGSLYNLSTTNRSGWRLKADADGSGTLDKEELAVLFKQVSNLHLGCCKIILTNRRVHVGVQETPRLTPPAQCPERGTPDDSPNL